MDPEGKHLAASLQVMCSSEVSEPLRSGILRVKASCHHLVNSSCLEEWVKMLVDKGTIQFYCPTCDAVWLWQEVRKMALFSEKECADMESRILRVAYGGDAKVLFQKCPRCYQLLQRSDNKTLCAACRVCSERDKKIYQFCWACKKEWSGPSLCDESCANELCPIQATLLSCPLISAPNTEVNECPSIRACPRCEALVTHSLDGCPEVTCPNCFLHFCYRCLKKHGRHRYMEEEECIVLEEIEDRENSFCILSERQTLIGKVWNPEDYSSSEYTTDSEEDGSYLESV